MYKNNSVNEGFKVLSPDAQKNPKLVKEYNRLVEEVENDAMYEYITEDEWHDFLQKLEKEDRKRHPENFELNEDAAWSGVSPYQGLGNINLGWLGKIFKPLKWLALPILAGAGLLLAGTWKLLALGKKQLAIARIRKWIGSLVVIADGGYKKKRKEKDSLFLIESRARRDILQAAVMCGYAAGLNIPEKTNEPTNPTESAKNESFLDPNWIFHLNESVPNPDAQGTEFTQCEYNNQKYDLDRTGWQNLYTALANDGTDIDTAIAQNKIKVYIDWVGRPSGNISPVSMSLQTKNTIASHLGTPNPQGGNQNNQGGNQNNQGNGQNNQPVLPSEIQAIKFLNQYYPNDVQGVKNLVDAMAQNGEKFDKAEMYIQKQDGSEALMDNQTKTYFKEKAKNIAEYEASQQKKAEEQDNQEQISAIENFDRFQYKNQPYNNDEKGILALAQALKNDGYDIKSDQIPEIVAVNSQTNQSKSLKGKEAREMLAKRFNAIKQNVAERDAAILPSDIVAIKYNNRQYQNTATSIERLFQDIDANDDSTKNAKFYGIKQNGETFEMTPEQKQHFIEKYMKISERRDKEVSDALNRGYDLTITLPDDSQIDWSLMTTLKAHRWFGLKTYKQNFWAEAKSAYKMPIINVVDETTRQKYILNIISNLNATLSKITNPNIARNYTNVINQFNNALMKRNTKGSSQMMSRGQAVNTGNLRVGNHGGGTYESLSKTYEMFRDDLRIFEETDANKRGFFDFFDKFDEYRRRENEYGRESEIDYDQSKSLIDNCFKATQMIFTSNPVSDFLVFTKTRDQMNNFLVELTKVVHTIIDSVAKKAQGNVKEGDKIGEAVIKFFTYTGSADPIQNRTLHNLWDNMARPKLDSRAITRLFEIPQTPEWMYFQEMLVRTIPLCIMSLYMVNDDNGNRTFDLLTNKGAQMKSREALLNAARKETEELRRAYQQQQQTQNQNNADVNIDTSTNNS